MPEEKQTAENTTEESTAVEESPTSEPTETNDQPDQAENESIEEKTTDEASASGKSDEVETEEESSKKPTRAERRIRDLSQKLKTYQEQTRQDDPFRTQQQGDDQIIKPEEYETGIDPQELNSRIANQRESWKGEVRNQLKAELMYEKTIEDFSKDIEQTKAELEENPALERLAVRQFEALNNRIDATTGRDIFVPVIKLSEVVKQLKQDLDPFITKAQAETSVKLAEQSDGAVRPSEGKKSNQYSQAELDKMMIKDPGAVRRMLEERLPVSND